MSGIGPVVPAPLDMTTLTVKDRAVRIMVLNKMVVENITVLFASPDLAATHTLGFDWMRSFNPIH